MSSLARYFVEIVRPQSGWDALPEATARARGAAEEMRGEGTHVRFVRSVFAPEDDACFFLYEAPSSHAVEEVVRRAELQAEHVVRASRKTSSGARAQKGRK